MSLKEPTSAVCRPSASTAKPMTIVPVDIAFCIFMAVYTPIAVVPDSSKTLPPKDIFSLSNHLQVSRIYAASIPAKMIYNFSWRNRPYIKFVRDSVGK